MDSINIYLENGIQSLVDGIFYIFDSMYYFIYTQKELVDSEYVQLYVVQVCKEVKNTENGPIDTGYMLGLEITDANQWKKVQESITKIVNDKKNNSQSSEVQYLPIGMLTNLKIVSKNKFKLISRIIKDNFSVALPAYDTKQFVDRYKAQEEISGQNHIGELNIIEKSVETKHIENQNTENDTNLYEGSSFESSNQPLNISENELDELQKDNYENNVENSDVIIDYRSKFFEVQDKNRQLEEKIKYLEEKLSSIKSLID